MSKETSDDRLIVWGLLFISLICILGLIALAIANANTSNEALITIAGIAVGALAGRVSKNGTGSGEKPGTDVVTKASGSSSLDDDFAVIGRAATKEIIAQAMRQMGVSADDTDKPKT